MTKPKNALLLALESQNPTRQCRCPRTELELEVRLLPRSASRDARTAAIKAWGDREVKTAVDAEEYGNTVLEHLLARAVHLGGEPIGLEAIQAVDEQTLRRYAAEYAALEDEFDPPLERWTDAQLEALVEGLKKKDKAMAGLLRTFDVPTLSGLLRYMGARLGMSETASSSGNSSGKASDSPSSAAADPQ